MEGQLVMTSEETTWVVRAKAGDQAAFAALFTRYERRIYSFVYRMMGNADDAYDLTQDTFLKAYRALDKTDEDLNVNAWLHRIASNACKHDGPSSREEDDPERVLIGDETQRAVQRVLDAMSPRNRQAMVLREYEGMSCEDIGEVMGASRAAVKSMLFRGREEFRKLYQTIEAMEGQS